MKQPSRHGRQDGKAKRRPSDGGTSNGEPPTGQKGVSDMRNYKHYIKREKESKVFAIVCLLVLLVLIVWFALDCAGMFDEPMWKPIAEYPMVNQHISWTWAGRM